MAVTDGISSLAWAGLGGGWAFADVQTVGYYAALVDCAARKHGQPDGFYVVVPMEGADRRMFACVACSIFDLRMHAFDARGADAELLNFRVGSPEAYAAIARGRVRRRAAQIAKTRPIRAHQNAVSGLSIEPAAQRVASAATRPPVINGQTACESVGDRPNVVSIDRIFAPTAIVHRLGRLPKDNMRPSAS